MPRKKPSSHSDQQFALFVGEINGGLDDVEQARFIEMVRRLVRADLTEKGAAAAEAPAHERGNEGEAVGGGESCAAPAPVPARDSTEDASDRAHSLELMSAIGQLIFQWSSNQRTLVRLLALMLDIDTSSADLIFSTLGTTTLRMEFLRRLARHKVHDRQARHELDRIVDALDAADRARTRLMGALQPWSDRGGIRRERVFSFEAKDGGAPAVEKSEAIDRRLVGDVVAACEDLRGIANALELLMVRLKAALPARGVEMAAD